MGFYTICSLLEKMTIKDYKTLKLDSYEWILLADLLKDLCEYGKLQEDLYEYVDPEGDYDWESSPIANLYEKVISRGE